MKALKLLIIYIQRYKPIYYNCFVLFLRRNGIKCTELRTSSCLHQLSRILSISRPFLIYFLSIVVLITKGFIKKVVSVYKPACNMGMQIYILHDVLSSEYVKLITGTASQMHFPNAAGSLLSVTLFTS